MKRYAPIRQALSRKCGPPRRLIAAVLLLTAMTLTVTAATAAERPNILVAIADDQSYPHASAYGYAAIQTPSFDRVARLGVLFHNAFTPAPGCSPMRAAFLTGRNIWQLEQAGTHASSFPRQYVTYQERLEAAGYVVGFTGKGWGPGNWQASGRTRNPAGPEFSKIKLSAPGGISNTDYAANFASFLAERPPDRPFSFWFGCHEPHRSFQPGIGRENRLDASRVSVPAFLPDTPQVRDDLLDYCYEIQWFDQHLGSMLDALAAVGELENTLVVVTSDNGMPFPRAKANVYEYGIHMPLAICWPARVPAGREVRDLVNLIDVTATLYAATGVAPPAEYPPAGRSLMNVLTSDQEGLVDPARQAIYSGRERHSSARFHSLGYPQRCVRTQDYLYIRNFCPQRWPAGAPQKYGAGNYATAAEVRQRQLGPPHGGYHDIDASPTLTALVADRDHPNRGNFLRLAVDRRPAAELFDIRSDPGCLHNLAGDARYDAIEAQLDRQLTEYLRQTADARVVAADGGQVWETYPRYSKLRWFPQPAWAAATPAKVPPQPWLEERRPR